MQEARKYGEGLPQEGETWSVVADRDKHGNPTHTRTIRVDWVNEELGSVGYQIANTIDGEAMPQVDNAASLANWHKIEANGLTQYTYKGITASL